jgi:cytochrome c-type biogenesis protein
VGTLLLALLAGALTVLNPCVLSVLPIVLLGALDEHPLGPLALAAGMASAFTGVALLVYGAGAALDLPADAVRTAAAVLMLAFGVVLLSSRLKLRLAASGASWSAPLGELAQRMTPRGLNGQFLLGALLGAAWSPCTGPTLGSAIALAAQSETAARAGLVMAVFGIGASVPLAALAYGSRQALRSRRASFAGFSRIALPVMGAVLAAVGLAILSGFDRTVETTLNDVMPEWLARLTTRF